MRQEELVGQLDAYYRPGAFDEHDGWDFCFAPGEWAALLARTPTAFAATGNGLMIAPRAADPETTRVYLIAFPRPELLARIAATERERGSPGALVVTHHVTDYEAQGRGLVPVPLERFEDLAAANTGVYVLHAPLDCHPEISTSGALVDGLGLRRVQPFASYAGGDDVESLREVLATEVDTYLTGTWWTPHESEWSNQNRAAVRALLPECSFNLLGTSHNASEQVVLRDQLAPLIRGWGVEVVWLPCAEA